MLKECLHLGAGDMTSCLWYIKPWVHFTTLQDSPNTLPPPLAGEKPLSIARCDPNTKYTHTQMLGSNSIVKRVFALHAVIQNQSHMPLSITTRNDSFRAKTGVNLSHTRDDPIKTKNKLKNNTPKAKTTTTKPQKPSNASFWLSISFASREVWASWRRGHLNTAEDASWPPWCIIFLMCLWGTRASFVLRKTLLSHRAGQEGYFSCYVIIVAWHSGYKVITIAVCKWAQHEYSHSGTHGTLFTHPSSIIPNYLCIH